MTFPQPSSCGAKPTDLDLVNKVQSDNGRNDALNELINRHSGIYVSLVNSYLSNPASTLSQHKKEILEEKDYHIYMAAMKYDPERGTKFSTHLGNETKWLCLNFYNKNKNQLRKYQEYNDDIKTIEFIDPFADVERDDLISRIHQLASQHTDKRVAKIFHLRYRVGEGNKVMAWERVSKQVGISIQGCINIHNKAIEQIKKQLKDYYA